MDDILGLLHFRDFSALTKQQGQEQVAPPEELVSCCLPVLLQLHDSYGTPPSSLDALIARFPIEEVEACRYLGRIVAATANCRVSLSASTAAAVAAIAAKAAPSTCDAELIKHLANKKLPYTSNVGQQGDSDLAGSPSVSAGGVPDKMEPLLSSLWVYEGSLEPSNSALTEQSLETALRRFLMDVSAFAAAIAEPAVEQAILATGMNVWGPLLPVLLPLLYLSLPLESCSSLRATATAGGVRNGFQQQGLHQEGKGTNMSQSSAKVSGVHTDTSTLRPPAEESPCAAAEQRASAQIAANAAARITRRSALLLCNAAVSWLWSQSSGSAHGESSESPTGEVFSRLFHNPPHISPGFWAAKPFLSIILNSPTHEDALLVGSSCVQILLERLRSYSFPLCSYAALVLQYISSCSPCFSQLVFVSLCSPEVLLDPAPLALLQLSTLPSAEELMHAAASRAFSLGSLRGPLATTGKPESPHRKILPGDFGSLLKHKKGSPYLKAELLLNYYIFCFDYEQHQTRRLLVAASTRGEGPPQQVPDDAAVGESLELFLEEAIEETLQPLSNSVGAAPLPPYVAEPSSRVDLCSTRWGVFAVAEMVGLVNLDRVHALAANGLKATLARAILLGMKQSYLQAGTDSQKDAEMGSLTQVCSLMLGNSMRHQDTWGEMLQRLGTLLYSQVIGTLSQTSFESIHVGHFSTSEDAHAVLRNLLPRALSASPFLSLKGPNQSLFAYIFRCFLEACQAWKLHVLPPPQREPQQHKQETDAVSEILAAHISSAKASLLSALRPLVQVPLDDIQDSGAASSPAKRARQRDDDGEQGDILHDRPDELLSLQCLLFVCQCGREVFSALLCSPSREVLRKQGQGDGGGFFGLPYAGLQRWMHLVAAFVAFLENHTSPNALVLIPSLSSPLDYPAVLTALEHHVFPLLGAAGASPVTEVEVAVKEKDGLNCSCIAVMLLYLIARMHVLPYFRARDGRYLRRLHSLPWQSAIHFVSSHPTLSHWMLRLFIEALQDCLPEAALFEGPPPLLSPSELISCGTLHPSSLAEADLVDPVCRLTASLALEFPACTWIGKNTLSASRASWSASSWLPSAAQVQHQVSLWIHRALTTESSMPAALETDSEMLQLYLQIEPLAGVAGAVCSLINKFFERDNNPTTASSPTLEWSPTNDDLPTELPSENIEKMGALAVHSWAFQGCVSPPRFKPAMLDAIYLCIVQNPLNLLLQLPANLIIRLLTSNVLARILLMLLMKLEAYAHMGPPTLPGRPPEPISAEEIIQLQETAVLQVVIEACCFAQDEGTWELLGRLLDRQANRRPQSLEALFTSGFPLEAVDNVCKNTKEVQRLLPLLCQLLRQNASCFWDINTGRDVVDATSRKDGAITLSVPSVQGEIVSDPVHGVRITTNQTTAIHPALAPLSRVDLCLFYLKCIVCVACDLRDNRPFPGDKRDTDPSFASENANAVFLEAIKHSELHESPTLSEFVAAAVPVIFPLFYTFPKLAALVSTFLAHRKLLRHDGNLKASPLLGSHGPHEFGPCVPKKRADEVLEQLEHDLSRVIELDL